MEKKTLTPKDVVGAIFGSDPKAIIGAIQGKRAKRLGKIKAEDKYEKRTIGLNSKGKVIVEDIVYKEDHVKKVATKKAIAKKDVEPAVVTKKPVEKKITAKNVSTKKVAKVTKEKDV